MGKKKTFRVGEIHVDSGRCWIGDPSYLVENGPKDNDELMALEDDAERSHPPALDGAPQVLALEPLGKGMGLIFPSGMGDGIYPVYITLDNNGRVESAFISFRMD